MDIKISLDDYFAEKMFNKHCEKSECVNCNCEVMLNEDYVGCFSKYLDVQLNTDVQEMFDKIVSIVQ